MKQLSSVFLTLLTWLAGILVIFLGPYFFVCLVRVNHAWFWPAFIAAIPIVVAGGLWLRFISRMTFVVQLDPEKRLLLHGNPLQNRPVNVGESLEIRRFGGIRYACIQFPDGTGVSFVPTLLFYFGVKRDGAQRRWREMVSTRP